MVSALALGIKKDMSPDVPYVRVFRLAKCTETLLPAPYKRLVALSLSLSFSLSLSLSLSRSLPLSFSPALSLSLPLSLSLSLVLSRSLCLYVCMTARTEFSHRKREASRKKDMCRWRRFTWPVLHPWPPRAAEVEPKVESSCRPTWSAAPCRNDAEERPLSTRTRSRCSDCFRWNLACLASGRATAFEIAWIQTVSRTCRRAAVRYCSLPPSVACPGGSQLQPRTPSRIIQRTFQRPPSDSVDRCCFESPRSRSAVSNARPTG